jgi:uncharacterized membrane protein
MSAGGTFSVARYSTMTLERWITQLLSRRSAGILPTGFTSETLVSARHGFPTMVSHSTPSFDQRDTHFQAYAMGMAIMSCIGFGFTAFAQFARM